MLTCAFTLTAILAGPAHADPSWAEIQAIDDWIDHATREHADAGDVQVLRKQMGETWCFQGRATVDVPAETLLGVATDIVSAIEWSSAGVSEAEVLSSSGDVLEYYQLLDVPAWTLSKDRYWFMRGRIVRDGASMALVWERLIEGGDHAERYAEVIAAHPKAIEPPVNSGAWVFTTTDEGTDVGYFICSASGGNIPIKLGMVVTTTTLPDTIGDLVREGQKRAK